MIDKIVKDSERLQANQASNVLNPAVQVENDDDSSDEDMNQMSVFRRAALELNLIYQAFKLMVQKFFLPVMPAPGRNDQVGKNVFNSIHEETLRMCQRQMLGQNKLYKTIMILLRVDCYVDDSLVRMNCKLLKRFTTKDFDIQQKFQLIPEKVGLAKQKSELLNTNVQ